MFRASSAHHQESLTVHTASSFCVCVCLRHRSFLCLCNWVLDVCLCRFWYTRWLHLSCTVSVWCFVYFLSLFGVYKFNVSWSVRASLYIPVSRPTDAACDRFLFSIYMYTYNSTCFGLQALIIRSPSLYIQPPVSVFVSVPGTVL
jgi:hypothetical protein